MMSPMNKRTRGNRQLRVCPGKVIYPGREWCLKTEENHATDDEP